MIIWDDTNYSYNIYYPVNHLLWGCEWILWSFFNQLKYFAELGDDDIKNEPTCITLSDDDDDGDIMTEGGK